MNRLALFLGGCVTGLAVLAVSSSLTLADDDDSGMLHTIVNAAPLTA